MNIRSLFKENLLIEVLESGSDTYYKSIVQEVTNDYFAIGLPMSKQRSLKMNKNSKWVFRLTLKDSLYYFRSRCVGLKKSGNIPLFMIGWPEEVRKVQRRQFFRFPCSFEAHYWILKKPWEGEEREPQAVPEEEKGAQEATENNAPVKKNISLAKQAEQIGDPGEGMILDISGGGVQLVAPQWLPMGTVVILRLFLKSKKKSKDVYVKGRVVWVGASQPERTVRFKHAIEFEDASDSFKEEIVQFIFVLMRERVV